MDIDGPTIDTFLPFDEPFVLEAEVPKEVTSATCVLTIVRRSGGTITPRTYQVVPLKEDGTENYKVKFMVAPIPPRSEVTIRLTVVKSVPQLTAFTSIVREQIENEIKSRGRARTGLVPAAMTQLQTALQNKFTASFPAYTANFGGTILDNSNWAAAGPQFTNLLAEYTSAFNIFFGTVNPPAAGFNIAATAPSPINNDLDVFRNAYRYAREVGNPSVFNALTQIISTVDSDWSLFAVGLMTIDPSTASSPAFPSLNLPSPDMSVQDLRVYQARIDQTSAALGSVLSFINTSVINDATAYRFINGGPVDAATATRLTNQFTSLSGRLQITQQRLNTTRTTLGTAIANLTNYEATFASIIARFRFTLEDQFLLTGNSDETFETRGGWYIGADAGLAIVPKISEIQPYYGANIYFAPINKNADYSLAAIRANYGVGQRVGVGIWLMKHACIHVGIIPNSITNADKRIENTWGNNTALFGAGLRLGPAFRITYGAAVVRGFDPDVLSTQKKLKPTPYISASVDVNLLKFFGKVGTLLNLTN